MESNSPLYPYLSIYLYLSDNWYFFSGVVENHVPITFMPAHPVLIDPPRACPPYASTIIQFYSTHKKPKASLPFQKAIHNPPTKTPFHLTFTWFQFPAITWLFPTSTLLTKTLLTITSNFFQNHFLTVYAKILSTMHSLLDIWVQPILHSKVGVSVLRLDRITCKNYVSSFQFILS